MILDGTKDKEIIHVLVDEIPMNVVTHYGCVLRTKSEHMLKVGSTEKTDNPRTTK